MFDSRPQSADAECDPTQRLCHDCLATIIVKEENVHEKKDSDDDSTAHGASSPPPYVAPLSQFVSSESAARASGNGNADFYLQKNRIAFVIINISKTVRQADMRRFFLT